VSADILPRHEEEHTLLGEPRTQALPTRESVHCWCHRGFDSYRSPAVWYEEKPRRHRAACSRDNGL